MLLSKATSGAHEMIRWSERGDAEVRDRGPHNDGVPFSAVMRRRFVHVRRGLLLYVVYLRISKSVHRLTAVRDSRVKLPVRRRCLSDSLRQHDRPRARGAPGHSQVVSHNRVALECSQRLLRICEGLCSDTEKVVKSPQGCRRVENKCPVRRYVYPSCRKISD